jgi:hypothetical protein
MKRLFRIFELSKNEQRVVLIIVFALLAITLIGYERRVHHSPVKLTTGIDLNPSPSPLETENER